MHGRLLHMCGEVQTVNSIMDVSTAVKAKTSMTVVVSLLLHERWATYGSGVCGVNLHWDARQEFVNEWSKWGFKRQSG